MSLDLYRAETTKPLPAFVATFTRLAAEGGFLIQNRESMAMAETFARHGATTPDGFDLHMIQLCKPEKAARSLSANPERAPLMPKFVMAFSGQGRTQVRFLAYPAETVAAAVDDPEFPFSLAESCAAIRGLIDRAL